jgi:Stealth protein CR2, conserved region 2/Stealth protein CR3, conserved region 3/Stealth protein CR4, conserved region 4/Stealth protein CR1, conserved region 1
VKTPLSVVGSATHSRLLAREDVVFRKGRFTLLNESLSPRDATAADLVAIHDALDEAGIQHLLVRRDDDRAVIAVDQARSAETAAALATAFAAEPFYARVGSDPASLVGEGLFSRAGESTVIRLYRPRMSSGGRLRYGASTGVRLEFWEFAPEVIHAPAENALMRRSLPRSEAIDATVELHDRTWSTLGGMFDMLASDVTFDIDMVFSWVDGSSSEFQRARAQRMEAYVVGDGDDSDARFRQIDELRFALRSVYLYAPWVRRIFIATDSPTPAWLADHPRVKIVRSEEFFTDLDALPTHNSHAVESQLHRIEGLSEHFLYSNDDMFFGRPVRPDMFFSPGGITRFIEATTRIGLGEPNPERSGFENAARVNRALLQRRFGRITTRHLEHAATPLRRSVMAELEREFREDFARTAASAFRSSSDISVTNSLYHYYALMTGRAVVQTEAHVRYIETTLTTAAAEMDDILKHRDYDFFCLNDGSKPEISVAKRTRSVRVFLERYFSIPAVWEKPTEPAPARARPARGSASSSVVRELPAG